MVRRALAVVLVLVGLAGLGVAALAPHPLRVYEDERDFLTAASHLLRSGTLSYDSVGSVAPRPQVFREPGYPALLAFAWRVGGVEPPRSAGELATASGRTGLWRAVRILNLLLLGLAAAACGLAARRLGGPLAGGLAFALVASSPVLQQTALEAMSENAAVALFAVVAASWAAFVSAPSRGTGGVAILALAVAPLVRAESVVLLPVAVVAFWFVAIRRSEGTRLARSSRLALVVVALLLPSLLWMARSRVATGHAALSDRGGLALTVRAELDEDVARFGARTAWLAWTPLARARSTALAQSPDATLLDHRPVGPGNFFTRTLRRWQAERSGPGVDPLAVDGRFRDEALGRFARRPLAHLGAAPLVVWRALFAERSPEWARPVDLTLVLGLLLAAGLVLYLVRALRRRDLAGLAFVAPVLALGLFHALATEFLPRYAVPLLPIVWTALALEAVALAGRLEGGGRASGGD